MPKKRPKAVKTLPPILHIYCEGEKTEPAYIRKYLDKAKPGNRRANVIRIEPTKKNTPKQLVEAAIQKLQSCPAGDQFWIVYDRESPQKYKDELHHEAYAKANSHGISIAISNVCFELWLLLHFRSCMTAYNSYDDLMGNSALKRELQRIGVLKYEKGDHSVFELIQGDIAQARMRAIEMNRETERSAPRNRNNPYQLNPYTDMYKLLDAIDDFN